MPQCWHDRVLYVDRHSRATYGQTRELMLRIAAWLNLRSGVLPGQRVALCLPMGMTAAQVTLGVLAAGASFVPLQFNGPAQRLNEILTGFEPHLLITTAAMAGKLGYGKENAPALPVITIDPEFESFRQLIDGVKPAAMPASVDADGMAAVFFTSGSTGKPKGAMMSFRSSAETAALFADNAPLRSDDCTLMLAPLHYASSLGLYFAIFKGCRSYIASEEEAMFPEVVADIIQREKITVWDGPSSRLRHLVEAGTLENPDFASVRYVEFFGEPMPVDALRAAMRLFPNAAFQNTYGSSEAFWMTRLEVPRELPHGLEVLSIGKALPCYAVTLRDPDGNEVASGEVGEICVVGPVALVGYWKRPDLTAAARLNGIPNSYRTGDLARLAPDGNYYLVGRRDHQVKIRGHRFELGEIEAVVRSHPSVREAVAFLVGEEVHACVQAEDRNGLTGEIRTKCARRLPVFARPARIVVMGKFPRLTSGKVDRLALQAACVG